jgi:hypothetical protein
MVSTLVLSGTVGSIFLVGYTIGTIGFGTVADLSPTVGAPAVTSLLQISGVIGGFSGGFLGGRIGRRIPAIVLAIAGVITIYFWWGMPWSLKGFVMPYPMKRTAASSLTASRI